MLSCLFKASSRLGLHPLRSSKSNLGKEKQTPHILCVFKDIHISSLTSMKQLHWIISKLIQERKNTNQLSNRLVGSWQSKHLLVCLVAYSRKLGCSAKRFTPIIFIAITWDAKASGTATHSSGFERISLVCSHMKLLQKFVEHWHRPFKKVLNSPSSSRLQNSPGNGRSSSLSHCADLQMILCQRWEQL